MANLKGSKTEGHLKEAFAGESQANRRYLYFASKADVEGYNDVAAVFRCGPSIRTRRRVKCCAMCSTNAIRQAVTVQLPAAVVAWAALLLKRPGRTVSVNCSCAC